MTAKDNQKVTRISQHFNVGAYSLLALTKTERSYVNGQL
jgi:hypothetical protein